MFIASHKAYEESGGMCDEATWPYCGITRAWF